MVVTAVDRIKNSSVEAAEKTAKVVLNLRKRGSIGGLTDNVHICM